MCFYFPICLFAPLKAQKMWYSNSILSVFLFLTMLPSKSALYTSYSLPLELFKGTSPPAGCIHQRYRAPKRHIAGTFNS